MDRIEQKVDQLLTGQANQAVSIQKLQDIVTNGLSGEIRRTMECAESLEIHFKQVCAGYDIKMKEFDEFRWFRKIANSFRDGLIKKLFTIAFVGGIAIGLLILFKHVGAFPTLFKWIGLG
jgi:hypothetical protein